MTITSDNWTIRYRENLLDNGPVLSKEISVPINKDPYEVFVDEHPRAWVVDTIQNTPVRPLLGRLEFSLRQETTGETTLHVGSTRLLAVKESKLGFTCRAIEFSVASKTEYIKRELLMKPQTCAIDRANRFAKSIVFELSQKEAATETLIVAFEQELQKMEDFVKVGREKLKLARKVKFD